MHAMIVVELGGLGKQKIVLFIGIHLELKFSIWI
jgi:hypothetical protein